MTNSFRRNKRADIEDEDFYEEPLKKLNKSRTRRLDALYLSSVEDDDYYVPNR